jgi:hypothetical protein
MRSRMMTRFDPVVDPTDLAAAGSKALSRTILT